jgi:hypothetical protein
LFIIPTCCKVFKYVADAQSDIAALESHGIVPQSVIDLQGVVSAIVAGVIGKSNLSDMKNMKPSSNTIAAACWQGAPCQLTVNFSPDTFRDCDSDRPNKRIRELLQYSAYDGYAAYGSARYLHSLNPSETALMEFNVPVDWW